MKYSSERRKIWNLQRTIRRIKNDHYLSSQIIERFAMINELIGDRTLVAAEDLSSHEIQRLARIIRTPLNTMT